jgi:hypothetical protein
VQEGWSPGLDWLFFMGDRVRKTKGAAWQGRVVGFYSTSLTLRGYAVESETRARFGPDLPRSRARACLTSERPCLAAPKDRSAPPMPSATAAIGIRRGHPPPHSN